MAIEAHSIRMQTFTTVVFTVLVGALAGLAYIYSGAFNAAADVPHSGLVFYLAQTARERSIEVRSRDIRVPDLKDPTAIAAGASEYAEMCTACHLAPGMEDNEMRPGLYPYPPNLADPGKDAAQDPMAAKASAARQFWIIKHGIKMSAMPAWGKTHDDATIWTIVAFLQKLPTLTSAQYSEMTKESESTHEAAGHESKPGAHAADTEHGKSAAEESGTDPHHHH